jgi:hypothetical protein
MKHWLAGLGHQTTSLNFRKYLVLSCFHQLLSVFASLSLQHVHLGLRSLPNFVFALRLSVMVNNFSKHVATSHVSRRNYYVIMPHACWDCGFESVGGTFAILVWVMYVFSYRSLGRADHSSRVVVMSVVYLSLISKPEWWGGLYPLELSRHEKKVRCSTVSNIKVDLLFKCAYLCLSS